MSSYRRPLWLYPLFQIPLLLLGGFLATALLFWLLGLGRPSVAVAIALDLSSSTYGQQFNAEGTIMAQEIDAVRAYLDKNSSGVLRQPNQVQVFGFADGVRPLTSGFSDDSEQIQQQLGQALQPTLVDIIGGGTNLDLALQEGIFALRTVGDRCRELLVVTDGEVSVADQVIAQANLNNVTINAVVIGAEAPQVRQATRETGGRYISAEQDTLDRLFTTQLFNNFNNNWRWILLWLGCAWIALMWMMTMPLDRWIFQGLLHFPMNLAGRFALGNALFWTAATPGIVIAIYRALNLALPFFKAC